MDLAVLGVEIYHRDGNDLRAAQNIVNLAEMIGHWRERSFSGMKCAITEHTAHVTLERDYRVYSSPKTVHFTGILNCSGLMLYYSAGLKYIE